MSINQSKIDIKKDSAVIVVVHNNTDTQIKTGMGYEIDFRSNDEWKNCEYSETIVTDAIAVFIESQSSKDFIIYLYPQYHQYESGKYRIVKHVNYGGEEIRVIAYFHT